VFIALGKSQQHVKFLCNGKYEASFEERISKGGLVLKCPPELDPSEEPLMDIIIVDKENPEREPVAYYMIKGRHWNVNCLT
jgi:hypothetical protein